MLFAVDDEMPRPSGLDIDDERDIVIIYYRRHLRTRVEVRHAVVSAGGRAPAEELQPFVIARLTPIGGRPALQSPLRDRHRCCREALLKVQIIDHHRLAVMCTQSVTVEYRAVVSAPCYSSYPTAR